jgi:signal transduction histidine kinase
MCGYGPVDQELRVSAADVKVDAINALVNALQPLDEAKIRVLRSAVHELRTPLTTVVGFVELLADYGPMTDAQHRVLRAITRSVQRLEDLVDALEPADPGHVRESTTP